MDDSAHNQLAQDEAAAGRIETINAGPVPTIYANSIKLRTSVFDIMMELGQIVDVREDKLLVQNQAIVLMSPQHAKVLSDLLARRLADYERRYGKIPAALEREPEDSE
jgi:hypothetical protein